MRTRRPPIERRPRDKARTVPQPPWKFKALSPKRRPSDADAAAGRIYNRRMATHSSFELALQIVRTLQRAGHVAYFAGGCVRDQLMGRTPADYDVATSARPEQVLELFPKSQRVGVAFGVVLVRQKRQTVEVATFRSDGAYGDGRHPESVTFTTAEEDAQRRDFTCNGLFYDPVAEQLHDFVGGRKDIADCKLRAIGDPFLRFHEDHLRMLRAVRFAGKLDFAIETATWEAMKRLAEKIKTISRERIGEEIRMMLEHSARQRAVMLLDNSGLLRQIWPRDLLPEGPVAWGRVGALPPESTRTQGLVAMQRDIGDGGLAYEVIAERLRGQLLLSNTETVDIAWLGEKLRVLLAWREQRTSTLKRLLADGRWKALEELWQAEEHTSEEMAAYRERMQVLLREAIGPAPLVTGNDLIALGATPGPTFKQWLEALYDRQLENEFPTREAALNAAKNLLSPLSPPTSRPGQSPEK